MNNTFLQQPYDSGKNTSLKKEIIRLFIVNGNYSITDLSKEISTSIPTVTKLIAELMNEGFVLDFGKQGTNGGRRPNVYGLNPDAGYFVGVDVTKDRVALGVITFKGQLIEYKDNKGFILRIPLNPLMNFAL